ncbi:son of sevenless homolog 2-like isoform X1 [Lytechinus variegatus]|uniref:son of sevenless homolog 2-like isoform X1 n=1 Tax=Lytechinus variegatus TaxID=7654 RepID=UPI001BB15CC9|nr:son of sevenless homolog 2-like isoform X1 [Lytechinus variegatus]
MMATVDFESEDYKKWRGLFVNALRKVQQQVHSTLQADEDSLEYIESLIICLLNMLCSVQPHNVHDIEDRVQKTFPRPIDQWAINDARLALEKGRKKAPLVLPVDKIHQLLKEVLGYRVDSQVSLYLVAVLEYIAADILKLAGNYVKNICHGNISLQDIKVAMCADKVLMEMFCQDDDDATAMSSLSLEDEQDSRTGTLTYDEIVKDLIMEETQYVRDLNLIIKVFRKIFVDAPQHFTEEDVDAIFGNILDIYQLTVSFLGLLEDAMEMLDDSNSFLGIGECFEEMAEAEEFEVYSPYAARILSDDCRNTIQRLVAKPEVAEYLQEHNIRDAVSYVLPKLLLEPIYHCIHYFDSLKLLLKTSPNEEEQEKFKQASHLLKSLQAELDRICAGHLPKRKTGRESSLRFHRRLASRQVCIQRMNEIQKNIEGWEGRDISELCNEFIMEGNVGKVHTGKNKKPNTERHIFLFDSMIVCCKVNTRRSVSSSSPEYRFKERYYLRKIKVVDKHDGDDVKNSFEIEVKDSPQTIVFFAKSAEEKTSWMEALITLLHRSTLERMLDTILQQEEASQPLRLPSPEEYCFVEEDSPDNIVFEEGQKSMAGVPLIKGGTLLKLIERLTYHKYADPSFVRTFLTTYRSFCKPQELLSLLFKRFEIPDPPPTEEDQAAIDRGVSVVREDLKRFRKEYAQPIQLRVLNVFRHWVDQHFYDFERDEELLQSLEKFIDDSVRGKGMRKWVESIKKIIIRRVRSDAEEQRHILTFERDPPPIEHHISKAPQDFDILTLHPIEIARQLTLLESDLYRAVTPSELVGSVWTKKDKHLTSPNLLKMIHHSNMFILWLEKCIVETSNLEERTAIVSRVIEIMMVFQEYNNFNGVLEIVSAFNSSAIHRLEHTFRDLKKKQFLEEAKELGTDHYKKYQEKLRSINPPCVPFLGMYLSNILFIEQGNPDFLSNCPDGLINFSKRRRVAEITGEIQQYQHQPYCLNSEPDIRKFFEDLNPLGDMTEKEFQDYLYEASLEIEPRNCKQLPKFPKKFEYSLKSPGIKPTSNRHMSLVGPSRQVSELRSPGFQRMQDEEATSPKASATPPSPRTPTLITPSSIFDHSVFSVVDIPNNSNTSSTAPEEPPEVPPPLPPRSRLSSTPNPRTQDRMHDLPPSLPPRFNHAPPLPPRHNAQSSQTMNGGTPTIPPRTYRNTLQRKVSNPLPNKSSIGPSTTTTATTRPPPLPPPVTHGHDSDIWLPRTPQTPKSHAFLLSHNSPMSSFPMNNTDHSHMGFTKPLMPPPRPRGPRLTEPDRPPRTPSKENQLTPEDLKFFESSY